jgi:hypothetical protein
VPTPIKTFVAECGANEKQSFSVTDLNLAYMREIGVSVKYTPLSALVDALFKFITVRK